MLILKAYAKINLALDVLHKRDDGYHQVEMIMQAIDLADIVSLRELDSDIIVAANTPALACDTSNLAYQAASLLRDTYRIKQGVHITLEKNIPMAAGLAGGSTDAAAVLTGLNRLWQLGLTLEQLEELGAGLGSDVPFCLRGGTMKATGRGEVLMPLPDLPPCYVVLAKPKANVSTAWVYQNYRSENVVSHPDMAGMIGCLGNHDLPGVANRLCNVLESVTMAKHPEIGDLKAAMLEYGAMASLMSGSGPTVFGMVEDRRQAENIARKISVCSNAEIIVTRTVAKVGK